nr:FIST N-terminal domain-containing protein [uncultured Desulfobacter sp.]
MNIASVSTTRVQAKSIKEVYLQLIKDLETDPDLLFIYCTIGYDISCVINVILECTPNIPIHGSTSCTGVMTQMGIASDNSEGLAMFAISDPLGSFGVGAAPIDEHPTTAAETAVNQALANADCPGEVPAMVWIASAPGCEEALLQGIANVLGDDVPVAGGSSADNKLDGSWKQFDHQSIYTNGVIITTLFPSSEVMFCFHSGYEPTAAKGIITKAGGYEATQKKGIATQASRRTLSEIDGHPAARIYNEWTDGTIKEQLNSGGKILSQTSLNPLGRIAGYIGDIPFFQLSHPDSVTPEGELTLFSDISTGEEVILMQGTVDSLIARAGRVATAAIETHLSSPKEVAGALIVYCAGCMLTVHDRLEEVVDSIRSALPDTPFLGTFTYGEQGCFLNGGNRHGNLMISVLLFSKA